MKTSNSVHNPNSSLSSSFSTFSAASYSSQSQNQQQANSYPEKDTAAPLSPSLLPSASSNHLTHISPPHSVGNINSSSEKKPVGFEELKADKVSQHSRMTSSSLHEFESRQPPKMSLNLSQLQSPLVSVLKLMLLLPVV
jgi:hypothetical protein